MLNLEVAFSPGLRSSIYKLLQSRNIPQDGIINYSTIPIATITDLNKLKIISKFMQKTIYNMMPIPLQDPDLIFMNASELYKTEIFKFDTRVGAELLTTYSNVTVIIPYELIDTFREFLSHIGMGCRNKCCMKDSTVKDSAGEDVIMQVPATVSDKVARFIAQHCPAAGKILDLPGSTVPPSYGLRKCNDEMSLATKDNKWENLGPTKTSFIPVSNEIVLTRVNESEIFTFAEYSDPFVSKKDVLDHPVLKTNEGPTENESFAYPSVAYGSRLTHTDKNDESRDTDKSAPTELVRIKTEKIEPGEDNFYKGVEENISSHS